MLLRALNLLMALNFLFSVVVQYNDPDPKRWMTIYGSAFLVTLVALLWPTRLRWFYPALVFAVAVVWSLSIAPREIGRFTIPDLFRSWEMKSHVVEEAREMIGLAIVAVWMLVLTIVRWRAERRAVPEGIPAPQR